MNLSADQTWCVVGILAGVGHQCAGGGGNNGLPQHAPAGVRNELRTELFQSRDVSSSPGLIVDITSHRDDQGGVCMFFSTSAQRSQLCTLADRKVRITERDQLDRSLG
ncbi:hypothetical protein D3C80_1235910 [compost metagenome]